MHKDLKSIFNKYSLFELDNFSFWEKIEVINQGISLIWTQDIMDIVLSYWHNKKSALNFNKVV